MTTITQEVLADLAELYRVVDEHLAYDKSNCQKIDAMYKLLITGNGEPPLPEKVREHGKWINEQKEGAKTKSTQGFELKKGVILLVLGQVVAIAGSATAIILGLKH